MVQTAFNDAAANFSRDGEWLAYVSDESGRNEVYLQPFPSSRGKRQISVNGGRSPRWRGDGRELFYIASDGKMMSAVLRVTTTGIDVESLRPLFDCPYIPFIPSSYDVTADGQSFFGIGTIG